MKSVMFAVVAILSLTDVAGAYPPDQYDNIDHQTAICRDGSHSFLQHHAGTCSHHRSVAFEE